jgi:hypothetical protein
MYSTTAYLYHQRHRVLIIDTSLSTIFNRRFEPVYAKKLIFNRGVDTVILFEFINQDQKPVNITGSTFTFRAIAQDGQSLLFSQDLVILNAATGRAKLTVASSTLDSIEPQPARWSIERVSGELFEGVYVDDQASSSGIVDIVDAVYPEFVASRSVDVPSQAASGNIYYTSTVQCTGQDLITFQISPSAFTGTVQIQGAPDDSNDWYDIGSEINFVDSSTLTHTNVTGFHPRIRLELDVGSGSISSVSYR